MNAESEQVPLKSCRHCSVVSRSDAETCPACGKRFERRPWRWWFAIPIAVLAFAAGYFGWQAIGDDEESEPAGLTIQEARNVIEGSSPARVERVLDGQRPGRVRRSSGGGSELVCRGYLVVDEERTAWEFCFLDGELEISRPHEF